MPPSNKKYDDIKRKLRELKKLERNMLLGNAGMHTNIRQSSGASIGTHHTELVWNKFFNLKEGSAKDVKYTIEQLSQMSKEEFKDIINEYFYYMYYCYYKESGFSDSSFIDLDLLTKLGLPMDSDYEDIIKSFKELVKMHHPDNGGDASKFLEIMESYNNFRAEK